MARPGKGPRLDKNPRGVWEIRWTEKDDGGQSRSKRLSTGAASVQEANQVFAGWLTEFSQDSGKAVPTIAHILEQYLAERGHRITDLQRQTDAANMVKQGLGDLRITEVDDKALARYRKLRLSGVIRGKRRRCTSDATLRRDLNCLKAAINYALKRHRIDADMVPYIELPDSSPAAEFWLTENEADGLLRFASKQADPKGRQTRAYLYLALGLGTAARMTSILELTWYQVDLKAKLIRYDLTPDGKRTGSQTKKRKVPVPLADWLIPILERAFKDKVNEYVLDGPIQIRRQLDKLCIEAAAETGNLRYKKLNRHALRHTAATHMARAGVDLWQLAGILGDTMQTVQKNYLHHCPEHLRAAVNFRSPNMGESRQTANDA
jgi:integrase